MNIAVNARFLHHPFSGIGQYLVGIIGAWNQDPEIQKIVLYTHLPAENPWGKKVEIHVLPEKRLPSAGLRKSYWERMQVRNAYEEEKPDIFFSPYPSLTPSVLGIPMVTVVHDVIPWKMKEYRPSPLSALYHRETKKALWDSEHIVTVSQFSKNELMETVGIRENQITVIPNGSTFDTFPFPTSERREEVKKQYGITKPYFFYVGGYDKRKNVETLVRSFRKYVGLTRPIDLVLGGDVLKQDALYGVPMEEKNMAKKHEGEVKHIGFIPTDEELACLYQGALGFVHFSKYEGFNLPILEAMKLEVPVMASDIEVHKELYGEAFLPVSIYDAKDIEEKWKCFLEEETRNALREAGKTQATQYSFAQTGKLLKELFVHIRS